MPQQMSQPQAIISHAQSKPKPHTQLPTYQPKDASTKPRDPNPFLLHICCNIQEKDNWTVEKPMLIAHCFHSQPRTMAQPLPSLNSPNDTILPCHNHQTTNIKLP